jgi:pyruvyl transferase EpsI
MIDENLRRDIIVYSKDNPMLIFPQTIYFTPDEKGEEETKKSKNVYNGNKKLCIAAREQVSFELMKKLYPDARIMLVPDIVLSTTKDTYGIKTKNRRGVMLCMRSDVERSIVDNEFQSIVDYIKELQLSFYSTDMHSEHIVTKENRYNDVKEKMEEFSRSKLVITDRLHGMIFAAITETPCIVFSNYNHKVKGTYE